MRERLALTPLSDHLDRLRAWVRLRPADKLTITSTPSGAAVEIDGVTVGATPYEAKFPGGYFRKSHTISRSFLSTRCVPE